MVDLSLLSSQVSLRRTFAIISHPDAGKTTLTEKLLLYSGLIRTAGMVRARKGGKATSSDWMSMEQERGISISASAMQFTYKGATINVLDTPGHQDFSEDTYRTLHAADCAVMVIDAAKGVETQTRKLFEVCHMKGIPVLTFVNKMDLPGRDPLDLLSEVEAALGILSSPINWPIGSGKHFIGVIEIATHMVTLFERSEIGGAGRAKTVVLPFEEAVSSGQIPEDLVAKVREDLDLLKHAGNPFDKQAFMAGRLSPAFFGSALTNFGVEPFFDSFVELAPSPRLCMAKNVDGTDRIIDPVQDEFSAFVFKIQANMNPKHRDCMAYLRVCSGLFERDMVVKHHRSNSEVRLSRAYGMVARDRNTMDVAYPGDVVGVINPGVFAISDTVSLRGEFDFPRMPQFPPEVVGQIRPTDVMRHKSFDKGLEQLCLEGAVQLLRSYDNPQGSPYVAAVGKLQFDVLQYRLLEEYNVKTQLDLSPYRFSSYLEGDPRSLLKPSSATCVIDSRGKVMVLFTSEWEKNYLREKNPKHKLIDFVG